MQGLLPNKIVTLNERVNVNNHENQVGACELGSLAPTATTTLRANFKPYHRVCRELPARLGRQAYRYLPLLVMHFVQLGCRFQRP